MRGYLDYDDLLENFANALKEKPNLRKVVAKLFDEMLVDEIQDTNPLQFRILRHFSSENMRLFYVGDPAQSDYRSGFYVQNKPTEGEECFLSEVPEELVEKEIHGWNPYYSSGLSLLKDVY